MNVDFSSLVDALVRRYGGIAGSVCRSDLGNEKADSFFT